MFKGWSEFTKAGYEKHKVFFTEADLHPVNGRSFIVTGANAGLGRSTAGTLAKLGGMR